MTFRQSSIKENCASQPCKTVQVQGWLGILFLLFLFIFVIGAGLMSCKSEIASLSFARLNVINLASTNTVDVLTNVEVIDYNTNMATTIQNLTSTQANLKEQAYYDFATNRSIFNWTSTNSILIEYGESESIFDDSCGVDKVVKIAKNNNLSGAKLSQKLYYGVFRPMSCGYNYTISITNTN